MSSHAIPRGLRARIPSITVSNKTKHGQKRNRLTAGVSAGLLCISFLMGGCGSETSQVGANTAPEFSSHIENVGTLSVRNPAVRDGDAPRGVLHLDLNGQARNIHVDATEPVFEMTSVDPASGAAVWTQHYRVIDGTRRFEISEQAGDFGLRWIHEELREGAWCETYYAIGVEVAPLRCEIDESQPETLRRARERLSAWLPEEVHDAVFDNVEGLAVNAIPRLLAEHEDLIPQYAASPWPEQSRLEQQWFEAVCHIATGCSAVKCGLLGGGLNPICTSCFGILVTCTICQILHSFGVHCT